MANKWNTKSPFYVHTSLHRWPGLLRALYTYNLWQTSSFQHQLDISGKHSASELKQREVDEIAHVLKQQHDSNAGSLN